MMRTVAVTATITATVITTLLLATPIKSFSIGVPGSSRRSSSSTLSSKWDNLIDEDDDDKNNDDVVPPDMTYVPRNLQRQHRTFLAIREAAGKELTNDVYVNIPQNGDVFWYVGKIARISDVSVEQAVARQWDMIRRHAANLRPLELWPYRQDDGRMDIWTAPGDSELEVAYNRPTIVMQKMEKNVEGAAKVKINTVGFQGETYPEGEDGFRTWRTSDGLPARPEINEGGENRPPTQEEIDHLQAELKKQNLTIEQVYEEQERRMKEG